MNTNSNISVTTIAVSKGRILDECLSLLAEMGVRVANEDLDGRKLVLPTNREDVRLLVIRATDVPTFVQYGAAELGVVGKDTLMEFTGDGIYEPVDLGIAKCRLMVAGVEGKMPENRRMRPCPCGCGLASPCPTRRSRLAPARPVGKRTPCSPAR